MANKTFKCPYCHKKYMNKPSLYNHIDDKHSEMVSEEFPPSRLYFNYVNKKSTGKCVICGKETEWNNSTERYNRFCSEKCKKKYVDEFQKRMIRVHGKTTSQMLSDPEMQKKMLSNRKISGKYKWSDGSASIEYVGSYELDFLKFLDLVMNFESSDIISPAPQVFYYNDNGTKRFYIPDFYIPSINTLVEIKDGQDNKAQYENRLERDAKKEALKDKIMKEQKEYNFVKVVNKDYSIFLNFLMKLKNNSGEKEEKKEKFTPVIDISEAMNIAIDGLGLSKNKIKLLEESLNMDVFLRTNPFKNEIILYHGSPDQKKFNIIEPKSLNAGNKFNAPSMSSFWSDNKEFAKLFALFKLLSKEIKSCSTVFFSDDFYHLYIKKSEFNKILEEIKNKVIHIYQKTISKDMISTGHSNYSKEFTINFPIKPDFCEVLHWKDYKNFFNDCIKFLPNEDEEFVNNLFKKMTRNLEKKDISLVKKVIYDDVDSTIETRKKMKSYMNESINEEEISLISESASFKTKVFIHGLSTLFDLKNLKGYPIETGDFKRSRSKTLNLINYCRDMDDIKYLRNDLYTGKNMLKSLKKNLSLALDNPNDDRSMYKNLRKRNKKGLTIEKIDDQINWIEEVYQKTLNEKNKELSKNKLMNESTIFKNKCLIISCFAGVGKNYAMNEFIKQGLKVYSIEKERNFYNLYPTPISYSNEINKLKNNYDVLFIPYFLNMEERYIKGKVDYLLVYPSKNCKNEYVKRFKELGFTDEQIKYLSDNFEEMIDDCDNCKIRQKNKIKLKSNEYLYDKIKEKVI